MAFDFNRIAGLQRGATFLGDPSSVDWINPSYDFGVGPQRVCKRVPFPHSNQAISCVWAASGLLAPRSFDLQTATVFDDSLVIAAADPANEGVSGETLADYIGRVGTPAWLALGVDQHIVYRAGFPDIADGDPCPSSFIDSGWPPLHAGVSPDGDPTDSVGGFLPIAADGSAGVLGGFVEQAVAEYTDDPANEASQCLFTPAEFVTAVLAFSASDFSDNTNPYHRVSNDNGSQNWTVRTYFPADGGDVTSAGWMCVL